MSTVKTLSPYPEASTKELLYVSLPLILSTASTTLMFFTNRTILAFYSTEALDLAVVSSMGCFMMHFGVISIASIAEVFVGQYNGKKEYSKLGRPVWQMIYFSLLSAFLFIPLSFFASNLFIPVDYQQFNQNYFRLFMGSGFIFALIPAIASFFIGQGKVRFVTISVIIANILNILFDIIFIFGVPGVIPEFGVTGAAMATALAGVIQVLILFTVFLNRNNRIQYQTHLANFDYLLFSRCIKIGAPNAFGHMFEIFSWTVIMHILASAGKNYITVFSVGQAFFVLFSFTTDGLQKGVIVTVSNLLGGSKAKNVPKVLFCAFKMHLLFFIAMAIPCLIFSELLVKQFLHTSYGYAAIIDQTTLEASIASMPYICLYFLVDGLVWAVAGVLAAAGKTMFILQVNAINSCLFAILPMLTIKFIGDLGLYTFWKVMIFSACISLLFFLLGYLKGIWKENKVIA